MVSNWDFQTALGDTLAEKYKDVYVKVVEISNLINRKTVAGPNWIPVSEDFFDTPLPNDGIMIVKEVLKTEVSFTRHRGFESLSSR